MSIPAAERPTIMSPNVVGVLWMLVAVILLTGMFAAAKHLMTTLPVFEVGMFRFLMSLLFYLPWLATNGLSAIKTDRPFAHFWRSFFGATSLLAGIYAVHHMLLADATVLIFTIPLWSILLAALFLGERVRLRRSAATIAGFVGVLLMVKPHAGIEPAAFVALFGAILATCAITTMKNLTRTEPAERIVFYFLFYGVLILGIPALIVFQMPTPMEWMWLAMLGFFGSSGQYCLTRAYAAGEMTIVAPFDFTRIIVAGIVGYFLFDELPDAWGFAGATVIMGSCVYIVRREAMIRQEERSSPKL
ncbi:MAG: DMT family transporter [Rhodospirillaceae bacterium]|jgi:drug/metabolite transporter (DMT)-like permease|nr:DMT family transporter [Rhodospirillaceae bacterium]MBT5455522.1 DMT family transporter [Rhodospirillaceae bacterium]